MRTIYLIVTCFLLFKSLANAQTDPKTVALVDSINQIFKDNPLHPSANSKSEYYSTNLLFTLDPNREVLIISELRKYDDQHMDELLVTIPFESLHSKGFYFKGYASSKEFELVILTTANEQSLKTIHKASGTAMLMALHDRLHIGRWKQSDFENVKPVKKLLERIAAKHGSSDPALEPTKKLLKEAMFSPLR